MRKFEGKGKRKEKLPFVLMHSGDCDRSPERSQWASDDAYVAFAEGTMQVRFLAGALICFPFLPKLRFLFRFLLFTSPFDFSFKIDLSLIGTAASCAVSATLVSANLVILLQGL